MILENPHINKVQRLSSEIDVIFKAKIEPRKELLEEYVRELDLLSRWRGIKGYIKRSWGKREAKEDIKKWRRLNDKKN